MSEPAAGPAEPSKPVPGFSHEPDRDVARLRLFMRLTPEEKLNHLEQLNEFLSAAMPESSKRAWQKLKKQGW